ncbi:hypothetical protein NliqN6_1880 [Naganishia liquefaciens]|uniref:Uncharacterized protein n=1 Tax=Naganishia liquefaciens TaxID=104408 RepID=A0A8H3YDQ9_9TREE|nr:hypothetical protein NliqN6_1880 [Naganishia liquefaciens]
MDAPTLDTIPPEILTRIAFYLAISPSSAPPPKPVLPAANLSRSSHTATASAIASIIASTGDTFPPSVFPSPLVPLLHTSRAIHAALTLRANPSLYARIFEDKFDVEAARRRLPRDEVHDGALASELRQRCVAMQHLKEAVASGDVARFEEQDVYTVYLMLIENDGKNLKYLLSPAAQAPLLAFLFLYHDRDLAPTATMPGLPPKTPKRALILWIIWLLTSPQGMEKEDIDDIEEFLFCLRPYVFAAGQFEVTYAPWMLMHLPLSGPTPVPKQPSAATNPYIADPTPRSRLIHITHYGRSRALCAPVLAHAAILNFFARVDRLLGGARFQAAGGDLTGGLDGPGAVPQGDVPREAAGGEGRTEGGEAQGNAQAEFQPRPPSRYVAYTPAKRSEIHDTDFKRLTRCFDPNGSAGMAVEDWHGRFAGRWEGSFSFFDYDAYKSMLSGESRALYEGQFGEQTQVWRLREVYARQKGGRKPTTPRATNTSPLNAGFELHSSTFDQLVPLLAARNPVSGGGYQPFNVTNAGSVTTAVVRMLESNVHEEYLVAMLGGLEGREIVSEAEVERIVRRRKGKGSDDDDEENVRMSSREPGDEAGDADDLELLLVGTGHSAWGEFLLRGRVRLWDGMVTLVKEYSPDGRGRWMYRGYVVGDNVFVGRWRDCVTPEDFVGYEGSFTLAQRIDETIAEASSAAI